MDKWWKNAVGYQIYIRSFCDSNDDGMGDINGITSKLDYLKGLGVDFIWVCPFYDSPMDDNGYDIRDYYEVDKIFGTNDDLKALIKQAHKRGIKVLIDLVMNHTSDEHIWFLKSIKKEDPYTNFYIWRDGKMVDGKLVPPNNWISFFSGSAWGYNKERGQYFLKIFSEKMPDINYECEEAFRAMEKVIEYFAKLHVDGFRVDAIAHIGKDLTFADSKFYPNKTYKSFSNLPNAHSYLKRFYKTFSKHSLVTMGELGGDPSKKDIIKYTTEGELDVVFSFEHIKVFDENKHKINTNKLYKALKYKESISSKGGWSALFWLNHDYPRLISKIRGEKDPKDAETSLATLMYMLKGTPIVYNGEEIGMTNYNFKSPKDFKDVNAKMIFKNTDNIEKAFENLKESSRDNSRTCMQWDDSKYAGFSTHKPWTYVCDNYKSVNVQSSLADKNSILNTYIRLFRVRKEIGEDIKDAKYKFFKKGKVLGYNIKCQNTDYLVIANFGDKAIPTPKGEVLFSNQTTNNDLSSLEVLVIRTKQHK